MALATLRSLQVGPRPDLALVVMSATLDAEPVARYLGGCERIRSEGNGRGFDAAKGEWVDMFKVGIIDPAKVTRSALQNAASIAGLVLTTESAVVEKPEEEEPAAAGGHGGHMH